MSGKIEKNKYLTKKYRNDCYCCSAYIFYCHYIGVDFVAVCV